MEHLFTFHSLTAFLTLTLLEIVLGIDNIVLIAIVSSRLPQAKRSFARRVGLGLAMIQRIGLLALLSWLVSLNQILFTVASYEFSGRSLILLTGGLFLVAKATYEIHTSVEIEEPAETSSKKTSSMASALIQITLLDIVFSIDSVITAVGMVNDIPIMVAAVIAAVILMMIFANVISEFILKHPSIKILALSFLLLIGVILIADGMGKHIERAYIYFAMGFAMLVEFLNFRLRKHSKEN